jgi:hypothetical protein
MAQVYGIPQYPVYSPLAGIADLYKEYKAIQRQEAQDAYAKEKDGKTFGLKQQELEAQREYQKGILENQQGARQENYASNWMRNDLERQRLEQAARIADCSGADKNTPACIQARSAGRNTALELEMFKFRNFPEYLSQAQQVYGAMGGDRSSGSSLFSLADPYKQLDYGVQAGGVR